MKRYLLFSGYTYYPDGGWEDFRGSFRTLEEAKEATLEAPGDWWQIVDTDTGKLVDWR